jgi:hypothetical protein
MSSPIAIWQALSVGDTVPLKTVLGNMYFMGVVTDPNVPNQFAATMEMFGDTAVITVPVLQGPPGQKGDPMFALRFQTSGATGPDDLPPLTNTEADIGKYWIFADFDVDGVTPISTSMFIWYGTEYRQLPVGSQGPPGPTPVITPTVVREPPGSFNGPNGESDWIVVTSGPAYPQWEWHIAFPKGDKGDPGDALAGAADVDLSPAAQPGQVLAATDRLTAGGQTIWEPSDIADRVPRFYTIPEGAFQSFTGITGQRQTVCTYEVPQQTYAWKPYVSGHMRIFGGSLSATPLLVGAEVRLGDPINGALVAVGQGNSFGTVTLVPHASSQDQPNVAITPDNATAKVAAAHVPPAGTLYVNLINEGFASAFDFNPADAQLSVMTMPVDVASELVNGQSVARVFKRKPLPTSNVPMP